MSKTRNVRLSFLFKLLNHSGTDDVFLHWVTLISSLIALIRSSICLFTFPISLFVGLTKRVIFKIFFMVHQGDKAQHFQNKTQNHTSCQKMPSFRQWRPSMGKKKHKRNIRCNEGELWRDWNMWISFAIYDAETSSDCTEMMSWQQWKTTQAAVLIGWENNWSKYFRHTVCK